ncbi:hypothetical protein J5N97_013345 [Dioscorea zingiberensis]|uniref:Btz domain-containing protein n=1 Tax=Dioscorea zingiberensis TaxID=325984 RepID=A0A9D5CQD9_9LILI|nr:hypothetical protein J5N97_013345 [Dioscorea zingiberensis]
MVEGEEQDYESDPEDALLPSAMRRREASDDEDGDRSEGGEKPRRDPLIGIGSKVNRTARALRRIACLGGRKLWESKDNQAWVHDRFEELNLQDGGYGEKRDAQTANANNTLPSSMQMVSKISVPQSGSLVRGKAAVDSVAHDKLYMNDPIYPAVGKILASSQLQSSVPSFSPTVATKTSQTKVQTRGVTIAGPSTPMNSSFNQAARVSPPNQPSIVQHKILPLVGQPSRISMQQMGQQPGIATPTSSPPEGPSRNSSEFGEGESPPGSSKSRTPLDAKEKISIPGAGMGSFLYNSGQVLGASGAIGLAHGDQGFPATPALLPVMQFGGQHPGGIGVPAVGMAFPGYVAQQQLGFGNSEMAWLPVLAGAAGALGASYCSPYIALDGSYHARSSGQATSSISSKETNTSKPADASKSPQRPENVNDELGQRQNKPRRYSEMNFGQ